MPPERVGRFTQFETKMIELISVPALISNPCYTGALWLNERTWWSRSDLVALKAVVDANADIEKCADALGRSPSAIAWKAHDTGLKLPLEWRDAIRIKLRKSPPRQKLQYPYITNVRGEHAELLQVNALVPHGLPDHMRADVCQEIMLALWMKEVSIEELRSDKALIGKFIKGFRKANLEGGGYALSLDVPMVDGRSWYDVLPDPTYDGA